MVGVLYSRQDAVLAAEVAGRLEAVPFELGQSVEAGTIVARIDDRALRESLAQATASLEAAQANSRLQESERAEAEARFERRMKTSNLYSEEDLAQVRLERDRAVENHISSLADVKTSRARVAELRLHFEATRIRAPFGGKIAVRYQKRGSWVSVGTPVVRVVGDGEMWVRFAAPPSLGKCLEDALVTVAISGLPQELAGAVRHISPEVDPASGLLTVEASLNAPGALAHSGLAVRVHILPKNQR